MHGIVLAGSFAWSDSRLDRLRARPPLPVALQPLISYTFRWLPQSGVEDAGVCLNQASPPLRGAGAGRRHRLRPARPPEPPPPRAAGLASDAHTFVTADSCAIPTVALADVLVTHRASGAIATVVVEREQPREWSHRPSVPSGMFVFERRALELVPEKGFQDIKENLI